MATVCKICADPKEPTLSLRRLPGPGPHRGGAGRVRLWTLRRPAGPRAPGPLRYGSWPIRGEAHCPGGRSIFLPRPPNPTVTPFPHFLPRGLLPPPCLHRGVCVLWPGGGRWLHVHVGLREGGLGGIEARSNGQTSKRSPWGFCLRLSRSWILPGVLQKSLPGVSLTLGISGPHGKLTRVRLSPSSPMYTSSWWKCGLHTDRRASTLPHRPSFPMWMEQSPTGTCALLPSRRPSLRTCSLQQPRP